MAVTITFGLGYTQAYIAAHSLTDQWVSITCEVKYTPDALTFTHSRAMGRKVTRLKFNIGAKAIPRYWASGRVKPQHPDAANINGRINDVAQRALAFHAECLRRGAIPPRNIFMLECLGKTAAAQMGGFFDDYARYIRYCDGRTSASFLQSQRLTMRRLQEFERFDGRPLTYEGIHVTFASEFSKWLAEQKPGRKVAHNTGQKHLKQLRLFLNHAHAEGWTSAIAYRRIKINERRNAFPITLEHDEVLSLWAITEADLPPLYAKEKRLILVSRDWFVFATQTALRYTDWAPERMEVVAAQDGGKNLHIYQQKTTYPLEIPLSSIALQVLDRNAGTMPPKASPAPTLAHINKLCALIGIRKRIGTHTARRTFATLQEKAGVPRSIIMRITGHRTEKDYLRYVGVTFQHNALMLRQANPAWFAETA